MMVMRLSTIVTPIKNPSCTRARPRFESQRMHVGLFCREPVAPQPTQQTRIRHTPIGSSRFDENGMHTPHPADPHRCRAYSKGRKHGEGGMGRRAKETRGEEIKKSH